MNIAVWAVSALLAGVFGMAGLVKASQSKQQLVDRMGDRMAWVEDFSPAVVRFIGIAEVLGAIGLILPEATGILPVLTPLAATCLAITMGLAALVHGRRKEYDAVTPTLVLLALTTFVAVVRFGS